MLIFGILILIWPILLAILIALCLIINDILVIVEEYVKSSEIKADW